MKHLVDSHSLLWYTLGDPQLSGTAKSLILDPVNDILISPASYWEIAIKISIGKLILHQPNEGFIDACLNKYGFTILAIDPKHTGEGDRKAVSPQRPVRPVAGGSSLG